MLSLLTILGRSVLKEGFKVHIHYEIILYQLFFNEDYKSTRTHGLTVFSKVKLLSFPKNLQSAVSELDGLHVKKTAQ